jgi:hypothetical protein
MILNQTHIIGIGSSAQQGKDTFFQLFKDKTKNFFPCCRFALADELKASMRPQILREYGIDLFSCTIQEKESIRFLLIEEGRKKRENTKGLHWINCLEKTLDISEILSPKNPSKTLIFVTDIRYPEEVSWIKNKRGTLLNIQKILSDGNLKPITIPDEIVNSPIVKKQADYLIEWPETPDFGLLDVFVENFLEFLTKKSILSKNNG